MGSLLHLVSLEIVAVIVCVIHEPQSCIFNLGSTSEMTKLEESFLSGEWTPFCDGTPESGQCGKEPVAIVPDQPSTTAALKQAKNPGTTPRRKSGVKRQNSKMSANSVPKRRGQPSKKVLVC